MNEKFNDVSTDEDTTIHLRREGKIRDFDVLYEFWTWDRVTACSAIFLREDVAHISDKELENIVRTECKAESAMTLSHSENGKYVFVNYGFRYDDY